MSSPTFVSEPKFYFQKWGVGWHKFLSPNFTQLLSASFTFEPKFYLIGGVCSGPTDINFQVQLSLNASQSNIFWAGVSQPQVLKISKSKFCFRAQFLFAGSGCSATENFWLQGRVGGGKGSAHNRQTKRDWTSHADALRGRRVYNTHTLFQYLLHLVTRKNVENTNWGSRKQRFFLRLPR